jgi:hypothetical protein
MEEETLMVNAVRGRGNSELTPEEVRRIRRKLDLYYAGAEGGMSPRDIAKDFCLATETVRKIGRRDTWRHVSEFEVKTEDQLALDAAASKERFLKGIAAEKEKGRVADQALEELGAERKSKQPEDPYE